MNHHGSAGPELPAILLPADQPSYEELVELSLEQRRRLPGRFHTPQWLDATPGAFICRVCWDEWQATAWPCPTAIAEGSQLFRVDSD